MFGPGGDLAYSSCIFSLSRSQQCVGKDGSTDDGFFVGSSEESCRDGHDAMSKVILGLLAAVFATIVAAQLAYKANPNTRSQPGNQAWAQNQMEFVAWNNERWTAWILGNKFEQLPQNSDKWSRHSNASLAFIDWEGEAWQAKIDADEFLLARRGDWNGTIERASAIHYRDWTGNDQLRTVAQLRR